MKIYNVIIEDRHCDPVAIPFLSEEGAVLYAREEAKKRCSYPEDYKESKIDGWLFCAQYSCEGDSVWVTEHEVLG